MLATIIMFTASATTKKPLYSHSDVHIVLKKVMQRNLVS